jgi:hypothetical protein
MTTILSIFLGVGGQALSTGLPLSKIGRDRKKKRQKWTKNDKYRDIEIRHRRNK